MNVEKYRAAEARLWDEVGLSPTELRVPLKGVGEVRVQAVGSGPPVLLLHGSPNSGSTWVPLAPHLAGFRCYLVDRPGTGLSDDFTLTSGLRALAERMVPELLDGLGEERAHVVASSIGGGIALYSAAAAPARVLRLVHMGNAAFSRDLPAPFFMKLMSLRATRWLMNQVPPTDRMGRSVLRQIGHGKSLDEGRFPPAFFEWYLALQRHTNTMRNEMEMIGSLVSFRGFSEDLMIPDEVFRAVRAPTLFLCGEDDPAWNADLHQRTVDKMQDATSASFAGFGHLPWLDDPERLGKATAAFLSVGAGIARAV